jgi:hypothetical protein
MTDMDRFFEKVITVRMPEDHSCIDIIDQTLLPGEVKRIQLKTKEEIWEAIKRLQVRGAPAIGICAGYGIYVLAQQIRKDDTAEFRALLEKQAEELVSTRPTAVNLSWAAKRMLLCLIMVSCKPSLVFSGVSAEMSVVLPPMSKQTVSVLRSFTLIFTMTMLRRLTFSFSSFMFSSGIGGRRRGRPFSWSIVVTIRKNINAMKTMSAIELPFISGVFFDAIVLSY